MTIDDAKAAKAALCEHLTDALHGFIADSSCRWLERPKPDYAFIYAKLARHVAAARVRLNAGQTSAALDELIDAMNAITAFETVTFVIKADDN